MDSILKWAGRAVGFVACGFFGLFAIGEGIPDLLKGGDGTLRVTLILLLVAVLGYILAWSRPLPGGVLLGLAGVGLGLNVFIRSAFTDVRFSLVYGLPFLFAGLMFLGTWLARGRRAPASV
jgi:hypothetical protein